MSKPVLGNNPFASPSGEKAASLPRAERRGQQRKEKKRADGTSKAAAKHSAATIVEKEAAPAASADWQDERELEDTGVSGTPSAGDDAEMYSQEAEDDPDFEFSTRHPFESEREQNLVERPRTYATNSVGASAATGHLTALLSRTERDTPPEGLVSRLRSFLTNAGALVRQHRAERVLNRALRLNDIDEFGFDPDYLERYSPVLDFLHRHYFRTEVSGLEHIPHEGPALIVANHSGTFPYDGAMLMFAVRAEHPGRNDVRPLLEDFVFHFPYVGTCLNRMGGVRACPENAERLLARGQLVAVFPEGAKGVGKLYRERYQLQRFGRGGFVKVALRARVPIIPASIVGAEEIHPVLYRFDWLAHAMGLPYIPITPTFPFLGPLGLVPFPSKWLIRFEAPIDLHHYSPERAEDRAVVGEVTDHVRQVIQHGVNELRELRRSVVFG